MTLIIPSKLATAKLICRAMLTGTTLFANFLFLRSTKNNSNRPRKRHCLYKFHTTNELRLTTNSNFTKHHAGWKLYMKIKAVSESHAESPVVLVKHIERVSVKM